MNLMSFVRGEGVFVRRDGSIMIYWTVGYQLRLTWTIHMLLLWSGFPPETVRSRERTFKP